MRILLLSHSPNDENAGASRIYHLLQRGLTSRGHAVDAYHLEDMGLPANPRARLAVQRLRMPHYLTRFAATLPLDDYDVVMSSSGMAYPLFRRLRGRTRRPMLVHHIHGLALYDHLAALVESELGHEPVSALYRTVTGPIQNRWDARGIDLSDATVVQNLRDLSWVRDYAPDRHVAMIPGAIHPPLLELADTARALDARDPELVWFGGWQGRKGAAYLPGAFRIARRSLPQLTLTIGGTGMAQDALLPLFAPEDRAAIRVLPRITVAEQAALFGRAAAFVFPSLSEGFGLALAEAMAFGMVGISGATGFGADFLTDHADGRIVPPSTEHVGRAIVEVMGDPVRRAAMAARGRDIAQGFTADRMMDGYEALFARGVRQP